MLALAAAAPTINLNKLQSLQRIIDNLEAAPTIYRGNFPSTYAGAINGFLHLPILPAIPAIRFNGLNPVYGTTQGYYNPHTGQITGQVVGSYPLPYNGYAHSLGWKH